MTDERHRCLAGPACRNAETTTQGTKRQRHGAITPTPDTMCEPCQQHIQSCVKQLPRDYSMLAATLGEHASSTGEFVRSTPTPAININVGADAIMSDIVDVAARAAAMVANQLRMDHIPDGRRNAPKVTVDRQRIDPQPHTAAATAETLVRPTDRAALDAMIRLIEPHIPDLITAPAAEVVIWAKPSRCQQHADQIAFAETLATAKDDEADKAMAQARYAAAECNICGGWGNHGQRRERIQQTGIDVALAITRVHRTARAHLGHTRLRHHYHLPCPAYDKHGNYCGAMTVGRDDGTDWVNCTTCGVQWTEREFDWLKTMIAGDKEIEMLRWLLAEAYARLDQIDAVITNSAGDPALELPGAGTILHERISQIIDEGFGHPKPENRKTAA